VANDSSLSAASVGTTSGQLSASDADGDPLVYSVVANPQQGVLAITNAATGAFSYTPKAKAHGTDSFRFKVNDGKVDSNVAVVTITIGNVAPVAKTVTIGVFLGFPTKGWLSASDLDGDALSYNTIEDAKLGSLSINAATGEFIYTPGPSFKGIDSFQFNVTDGKHFSNVATVTLRARRINIYLPLTQR
jgi:hypothetical protein